MIAKEWAGQLDAKTITGLARYTYLASITHGPRASKPFLVHGLTTHELHGEHHHPEQVADLDALIQQTTKGDTSTVDGQAHEQNIRQAIEATHSGRAREAVSRGHTIQPASDEEDEWEL